jgi:hypothetical protein
MTNAVIAHIISILVFQSKLKYDHGKALDNSGRLPCGNLPVAVNRFRESTRLTGQSERYFDRRSSLVWGVTHEYPGVFQSRTQGRDVP